MLIQPWIFNQLVKLRYYRAEIVDQAISEMLARQNELRRLIVVGAYSDGEINLGKAAELLGMHRLELQEQFIRQGIPLRFGSETLEDAKAEIAAIDNWNIIEQNPRHDDSVR
jgi:predicted HTH domain antitoxin